MNTKPTIAILGGTGDLGSGLAKCWLAAGYKVILGSRSAEKARSAAQTSLNWGQQPYDPLFPYGFGLTYADHVTLPALPEVSGVDASLANTDNYFLAGHTTAPWGFVLQAGAVDVIDRLTPAVMTRIDDITRPLAH